MKRVGIFYGPLDYITNGHLVYNSMTIWTILHTAICYILWPFWYTLWPFWYTLWPFGNLVEIWYFPPVLVY
jgi:hypothetical protein